LGGGRGEIGRLIRGSAVQKKVEAPDGANARWCIGQYFRELAGRFKTGFDPAKTIPANPDELTPPAGVFILARIGGQPIGCGALQVKDRTIREIKRMWVAADARGLGVGRHIREKLETHARAFGGRTLWLETNRTLKEARCIASADILKSSPSTMSRMRITGSKRSEYDDLDARTIGLAAPTQCRHIRLAAKGPPLEDRTRQDCTNPSNRDQAISPAKHRCVLR